MGTICILEGARYLFYEQLITWLIIREFRVHVACSDLLDLFWSMIPTSINLLLGSIHIMLGYSQYCGHCLQVSTLWQLFKKNSLKINVFLINFWMIWLQGHFWCDQIRSCLLFLLVIYVFQLFYRILMLHLGRFYGYFFSCGCRVLYIIYVLTFIWELFMFHISTLLLNFPSGIMFLLILC